MKNKSTKIFITFLLAIGLFPSIVFAGFSAAPKAEEGEEGLIIRSAFEYNNVDPGQTITDEITVNNQNDEPVKVILTGVDAGMTIQGGFVAKGPNEEKKEIGLWTKIEENGYELDAGETKNIPFTIIVPENASPGEHSGALTVEAGAIEGTSKKTGFAIKARIATKITVMIKGDVIRDFEIGEITKKTDINGKEGFEILVTNTGNVAINPRMKLTIKGYQEEEIILEPLGQPVIQPGEKGTIPFVWDKAAEGTYTASLDIDVNGKAKKKELKFKQQKAKEKKVETVKKTAPQKMEEELNAEEETPVAALVQQANSEEVNSAEKEEKPFPWGMVGIIILGIGIIGVLAIEFWDKFRKEKTSPVATIPAQIAPPAQTASPIQNVPQAGKPVIVNQQTSTPPAPGEKK